MKLSSFIAGTFGVITFVISIFAGLMADNSMESILLTAIMFAAICYVIGYGVGLAGQQVSAEHSKKLAKRVADQDAAEEQKRLEKEAALEAESAERAAGRTPLTPQGTPVKA
jgi:hypothetical protein